MKDASALSDAELRSELIALMGDGSALPPITGTTRTMLEKKLVKLRKEKGTAAKQQVGIRNWTKYRGNKLPIVFLYF